MLKHIYKSYTWNVAILEAWWTHIRPRFSGQSVWSPLTWFTLRPKRTTMNLKWRNEGKDGEEQSDHLSWVSSFSWNSLTTARTLNKTFRFQLWGNWICDNGVWKFTHWWTRWSCGAARSWFPLEQYLKSAYLYQTENVKLFTFSHPVSWHHGSHAGLLIETWSDLRHQVPLTERILNTQSMINNPFILW